MTIYDGETMAVYSGTSFWNRILPRTQRCFAKHSETDFGGFRTDTSNMKCRGGRSGGRGKRYKRNTADSASSVHTRRLYNAQKQMSFSYLEKEIFRSASARRVVNRLKSRQASCAGTMLLWSALTESNQTKGHSQNARCSRMETPLNC